MYEDSYLSLQKFEIEAYGRRSTEEQLMCYVGVTAMLTLLLTEYLGIFWATCIKGL
jgi:hypothetical protein